MAAWSSFLIVRVVIIAVVVALDTPPVERQQPLKKRQVRGKKKLGSPEVAASMSADEGSDSADEYHDALPGKNNCNRRKDGIGLEVPCSRIV